MPRKTKKKIPQNKHLLQELWVIVGILLSMVAVIVGIFLYRFISFQLRPVTEESELQKIPGDVKKQMEIHPTSISATIRVPILLYHYVENVNDKKDLIRESLNIQPFTFEEQVKTLVGAGFTFMTAKELGEVLDGTMQLPPKPILLTFDDGHWDFDTDVLPILKKYQVKATAYIISGFLGGSDFMTPSQLQDVINSGLIDVGAHTVHHIALKGKVAPLVSYEINTSKNELERIFHIHVVSFAYPDGSFDEQAIKTVSRAGFTTAVSTLPGVSQNVQNRFFLYRIRPGYRTGQVLLNYLNQSTFSAY